MNGYVRLKVNPEILRIGVMRTGPRIWTVSASHRDPEVRKHYGTFLISDKILYMDSMIETLLKTIDRWRWPGVYLDGKAYAERSDKCHEL